MVVFSMWNRTVHYENGWFIYADEKGHFSVISIQRARDLQLDHAMYQASQDIARGGCPYESALSVRGIRIVTDENGREKNEMASYAADSAAETCQPVVLKGVLSIPREIGQFTIDMIYDEAFSGCVDLEKVILPETVTSIGEKAFFNCINLVDINLPDGLTRLGKDAFAGTQLESDMISKDSTQMKGSVFVKADPGIRGEYIVPEYITVIADSAFAGCKGLTHLILQENITGIGEHAFEDCSSLMEIRMPKRVQSLGMFAFEGCSSLEEVVVPEGVRILDHFRRCSSLKKVSIPSSVEIIDYRCFSETALMNAFLAGKSDMLIVDHWLIRYKVTSESLMMSDDIIGIADQDWEEHSKNEEYRGLKSLRLSSGLKHIGDNAFERTGITKVVLPEGLLSIGNSCFRGTYLRSVKIPRSVKRLGRWALSDCECLEKVIFLGNTEVVDYAVTGRKDRGTISVVAITGRKDRGTISVVAMKGTLPHAYVNKFARRYQLQFIGLNEKYAGIEADQYSFPEISRRIVAYLSRLVRKGLK